MEWPSRVFTSRTLLRIARKGVNRSKREHDQAVVAILFSAAAVEGFLNDVMEFSGFIEDDDRLKALHDLLVEAEDQKAQVAFKFQLTNLVLKGTRLNRGDRVSQELELLFKLRNSLIHMRPDRGEATLFTQKRKRHPAADQLVSRGVITAMQAEHARSWVELVSCHAVAKWAYDAATHIAVTIFDLIESDRLKDILVRAWTDHPNKSIGFPGGDVIFLTWD